MTAIAYLNGTWQSPEDAKVSVLDRGFMFGDGIYEVIPVYSGRPFALARHLVRLNNSFNEIRLASPLSDAEWSSLMLEGVARSGESTASIYVQITRGVAPKRDFKYPEVPVPTVLMIVAPSPLLERTRIDPLDVVTLEDFRWARGHIKTTSLIAAGMLRNEAIARGADDAILIKNGKVTEATASNVLIARNGVLATPPRSNHVLHGITRDVVVALAREHGLAIEEREIDVAELETADEIMITSSTHEVWPVGSLNGKPVGNGAAGVMWRQLDGLFQDFKRGDQAASA
ncbi:MAG TPA: aminotransferase class IV [Pseudomonadales bacterium]|nr:aminotransferase class IV [Pseudomonadales bacterium]